jgi:tripartite-type tricarboxylate transporter receptor subunit TctC
MHEAGLANVEVSVWHAFFAPKGTAKPIVEKLVKALQEALRDSTVKQRFAELGAEPVAESRATPEALRAHLRSELDKWAPIIKKAGVFAD